MNVAHWIVAFGTHPVNRTNDDNGHATGIASIPHMNALQTLFWQELSDVCIYLLRLSDVCGINLSAVLLNRYDGVGN